MIIVDTALERREDEGRPIRVAIIGAGYMGRGTALQIMTAFRRGMRLVAMSNRTISQAEQAYTQAGVEDLARPDSVAELEDAIRAGRPAITDDPMLLCEAEGIDAIVEATGEIEFGAHVVLRAIEFGKHVILMNAELDAVAGPILKVKADQAGVVITNVDGDQPGVVMNLYRWVKQIGYQPVLAGNIKGLQDHYRTPETQKAFADAVKQKPKMITSFADGTKVSMEMAVVANATGFGVGARGMHGPRCDHVTEAKELFPMEQLMGGGIVDFILGAEPGPGVFVLGYNENPIKQQYLQYLKMGDGPLYVFYIPYHFPHLETPLTVARAALFHDAATSPLGGQVVEVITAAKTDLAEGTDLDGIGGFHTYGLCENVSVSGPAGFIPMSLAEGCRLKRNVAKDEILRYEDLEVPAGRLCDSLRAEQDAYFDVPCRGPTTADAGETTA
ncbi:MAG: Gfo/Idh/MocA family oxidoreductase [Pseudomonadota bacterium]|nr:Gfo/Idh/MocA family oxidoreductase [Pseudomonadota bacterium]